jgi:ankyrin repeat protein
MNHLIPPKLVQIQQTDQHQLNQLLSTACRNHRHDEISQLFQQNSDIIDVIELLQLGADINCRNSKGQSILHLGIMK